LGQYFCAKKIQSQTVTREKLPKTLSYKKGARKTLIKFFLGLARQWQSPMRKKIRYFLSLACVKKLQ